MGYGGKLAARTGDVRRFNFTGNGSNTAFGLGFAPATQNQLIVTINGVVQHYDAFSVTGSTLTFTGTPAAGDTIQVVAVVDAIGVMGIADGAIANVSSLRVTTTPVLIGNAVGTFTGPLIQAASSANSWIQINAQNLNNGNNASTDLVLARSDGSDTAGFIDVGINSNTYSQAGYSIMTPNSGYMFTNGGDLFIGTQTAHAVAFHTGNTTSTSERMRIAANGHVGIGNTTPYNGAWGANTVQLCIGNYNVAYGSVHLNGGSGSNTSYSFGVGEGKYYMAYDNTANQHRMNVNPAGSISMPYQPHARASRNSGTIGYNSVIIFNYADDDPQSIYNTTNGRFTAPVAGRYLFAHGMFSQSGYPAWLKWRVNGTVIASTYSNVTSAYSSIAGSIVLRMNASDYADLWVDSGSSSYNVYGGDRSQCWATFTYLG